MTSPALLSHSTIVVRSRDILEAEVDGEIVALDLDKGNCYGLNAVGSRIWQILAEPISVADITTRLQATYDVDEATCEQQVLDLLNDLCDQDLVKPVETAAP